MSRQTGKLGLSLSGGAAKGLAHIGALEALLEYDLVPDVIAGTSAGALVGGLYAAGIETTRLRELVNEIDTTTFGRLVDLTWARGSIVAGKKVEEFLLDIVGDVKIENLDTTFVATAVDINTGTGHYLTSGPLVDAIRASISIPGIFQPVAANGGYLVDGGLRRNLPIEILSDYDVDATVAVNICNGPETDFGWKTGPIDRDDTRRPDDQPDVWTRIRRRFESDDESPPQKDLPGIMYLATQAFNIVVGDFAQVEIEAADPDLVIQIDMSEIELWEFWRGSEAADIGYQQSHDLVAQFADGVSR